MEFTYDVTAFKETFEHEFTWLSGFMRNVHRFADKRALFYPVAEGNAKSWTYAELNCAANKLGHAFQADGIKKNDVVMYMLYNSPEFVFCYIACHKIGAINSPVNYRLSSAELAAILEDSRPRVFVYDDSLAKSVRNALELSEFIPKQLICVRSQSASQSYESTCLRAREFESYIESMSSENPEPDRPPHIYDETTRLYTSGTTNRARAVPMNAINEVLSSHDVMMHFPLNSTDLTMNMTPWFHRGGLHSGGPTPTLYAGGEVVILREFSPKQCLHIVQNHKVTFLIGVPSIIALLARIQEREKADLSSLRGIVTMGSPFEKVACEKCLKLFTPNIFNGYGTTETFWNTFLRPYDLPAMAGTAGRSCTDDEVRIVHVVENGHADPDDLVAKDNTEVGEIIIKSPAKSTMCYVNNPKMTREKFHKGYHYTGDLGTWDANEFVTIVSRKDDMILCNGENIYPTQIEAVINAHPKVQECAVVGVADRLHGQCVAAYIVPSDPSLTVDEIKRYCFGVPLLSAFKRPRFYYLVKELPHTATGKITHYVLRKKAMEQK
ncbi:MAG: AMP-binding protein [Desulfovibrionaceae bacterium]|nr:AMP-binding protein [Desulfovibrionaceae bacterium]